MSRIVKNAKLIGTKNNVQLWLMHIECDTMQDLPAANAYGADTLICIGSTAHIIEDNATLEINSSGNWIQQQAGSSTYTRAEIDSFLSAIDAEIDDKIGIEDVFGAGIQILPNGTVDITEIGNFYCQNAQTAATVASAPWTDSGFFGFVKRSILPNERFIQIAIKNNDTFAVAKRRYTGTWQPWSYSLSEPISAGNYIMAYADTLPSPGVYFAYHIAGSGIDKPVSGHRFMYQIMIMTSAYGCIQAFELDSSSGAATYIANKIGGTWTAWYKFESSTVI